MFAVAWSQLCGAVLIVSGGTKLVDPDPTAGAMSTAGLPASRAVVLVLALWEIFAGSTAVIIGGRVGGSLLFLTYTAFAVFIGYALRNDLPIQSCGCFGRADTPPSALHLVINGSAALAGGWLMLQGGGDLISTLRDQPLSGIPYLAFAAIGVYAIVLILTELPAVLAVGRVPG